MRSLVALLLLVLPVSAARQVALITEGQIAAPATHGLLKLEQALRTKGFEVVRSTARADYVIHVAHSSSLVNPEALSVRRNGKNSITLQGSDARGLMYAALDTADRISWSTSDPFEYVRDTTEKPYLLDRSVSMYTMQRAYLEQRLYDEEYWKRYFDMLSASRINNFIVIFGYENGGFMAPPYPYFFNAPEFPQVELVGITKEQQARNTASFKAMIRLAHERGIDITAAIWDHIYRGGVQGGGISGASENAGKRVPGLVWGVTADNLAVYSKVALRRFIEVFPEIDGLQFRMHDESGLKNEEVQPFWHDVFVSIKQSHPGLKLDLRAKGLPDPVIDDALNLGLKVRHPPRSGWLDEFGRLKGGWAYWSRRRALRA